MDRNVTIRPATLDDAEAIVAQRRGMFSDMGMGTHDARAMDAMANAFRPWLQKKMSSGEYLGWVAVSADGTIVAGLGLWLMDWPPQIIPGPLRGNVLNVYTDSQFRRQGIARRLMKTAIEWCRLNGVRIVILHASDEGRPLYEQLGFMPSSEMRLNL